MYITCSPDVFHKQPAAPAEISDFLIRFGHSRTEKYQSNIVRLSQFFGYGGTKLDAISRTYGQSRSERGFGRKMMVVTVPGRSHGDRRGQIPPKIALQQLHTLPPFSFQN